MASYVQTEKDAIETNYVELTTAADQQGEVLHHQIAVIVNQRKSDIADTKNKHLTVLQKHADEITQKVSEIKQVILEIKNIVDINDISLTSTYKSRNEEFNKMPPKIEVTLPSLSTPTINNEKLNEMIGSLSSITTDKQMLDEPRLTATINTGYNKLYSVASPSEEQVWACGLSKSTKLLNLQGKLLSSITTKSGYGPSDTAVTRYGNLVYTDSNNRTVNLVNNKQISTVITLQGWVPLNICCTASDDLLVTMCSDEGEQSKVVRYSGPTETQTIQFDDQARPLFSSNSSYKYISENRNLDICVADHIASAVVVVNQSGKPRFRYTGNSSNSKESFDPVGITTDSQGHILTAANDCIHILDQDGQFLRYIQNCHLEYPRGLCVDIKDNLFVAEYLTAKVKKIQYQ